MSANNEQFNSCHNSPEPSGELFDKIMLRIREEKKLLMIRRRILLFAVIFMGSIVAMIPSFNSLMADFSSSGFEQFFSLLFSDGSSVLSYWQSFGLTLLESLPVMSIIIMLTVIWAFLASFRFLLKDIKTFNSISIKYGLQ